MPRSAGVYQLPPGTTVSANTTIQSAWANAFSADIQTTFNTAWPVALGGTGGTNVITSFDALATAGTAVATAGTMVLSTVTGPLIDLTGTTTVTAVTLGVGQVRLTRATGDFQITVGASLIGNGGGLNVSVKTGDLIIWEGYAAGVVQFWVIPVNTLAIASPWVAYTPTFTGLGTVSGVVAYSRRNGPNLEVQGSVTAGTTTAANTSMTLGFNGTNGGIEIATKYASAIIVIGNIAVSFTGPSSFYVLAYQAGSTVFFSRQNATSSALAKVLGNSLANAADVISFNFSVPIQGWN